MKVISSESNKLFYSFIKLNRQYKTKTDLLNLILARFPKEDQYYFQTKERLNEIQNEYTEFVNLTTQKEPTSFVARYILSAQLPIIDMNIPVEKHLDYLKANGLNHINFNDALLINSDLFTNKSIEYLTYFGNPQLPKELLEKEFMKAIDSLLNKAKVNQLVYQHITEYLIDGFKKYGFDLVLDYIVENYVIKDDLCLDEKTEGMIKRRIDQARILKIGSTVPDIILPDHNGKEITLSKINSEKILVVFYASWCPHCKELLPKLNELKKQNGIKLEVVAISLDTKKDDWINFLNSSCSSLINLSDLKGWDGKAAKDYFIYATPTMFLIDHNLKIVAKPMTIEEINQISF
jgi:thiol-disulfide isomerase/thioredoxin